MFFYNLSTMLRNISSCLKKSFFFRISINVSFFTVPNVKRPYHNDAYFVCKSDYINCDITPSAKK